ncbi:GNAT family N-acetyltransferase [Macrococcus armenti]|uniref:GNAT family N-acetyltransferase n=1 Tax=Macrococcus armenti TaxID=2875764 RepID=UPI001CCEFE16|nr:GNAT family N-acetyltransferase [Macrococcus armenti]UBH08467.1 GNAT family N-acetyltransferase [Macrococcus armenti]UBH10753.1 GNAT family N-acetyltransferase [Macrococcus armenti]UBH15235.1 GNAT family N-acetyltransferase [Macrococcus armenti]UBH17594.1 GNAT family N-acetyltransferase [Macrococcus armenti]UBH19860.1 GNAT family N-acetyltransferase [Macrococcus armenti]
MVSIRKATQDDITQIKDVVTKAWHDTYKNIMAASTSVQFLEASFSTSRLEKKIQETLFLVAEVDGKIVGFANFIYGKALNLSAIYVLPEHQRHQIGTALLHNGLSNFTDYDAVFVEVALDNERATKFYYREDFELVREYEEDILGEKVLTGLLKKEL